MRIAARLLAMLALPLAMPLAQADESEGMEMRGMTGPYSMQREASGTAWQPDATPMEAIHSMGGMWTTMLHGYLETVYDHQGGPRGGEKTFTEGMFMFMAQRPVGDGEWGLRAMLSPDPQMGKDGYPLLFGSGETANGRTPLIDRQHPHDAVMELASTASVPLNEHASAFLYGGLPGEPALGPPAFMHRFSAQDNPEAPISHHWFDSTHITDGVITAGASWDDVKLELSGFHGREPDEYRYRIESGALDSYSERVSWNPSAHWSLQASQGHLTSPEQLEPALNVVRTTVSAIYQSTLLGIPWGTTLGWGENRHVGGDATAAVMLESALRASARFTLFTRIERMGNDELIESGVPPLPDIVHVTKASFGGLEEVARVDEVLIGVGALVSRYAHGAALDASYGHPTSFMLFVRLKLAG